MAHVYGARAVVPQMEVARGEGYLLQTASAAGLLSHPESGVYAVTKHAAVRVSARQETADVDRWLGGMRRLRTKSEAARNRG